MDPMPSTSTQHTSIPNRSNDIETGKFRLRICNEQNLEKSCNIAPALRL